MKNMIRLIYTSHAVAPVDDDAITALLTRARRHNYDSGITGMLSFGHGYFLQLLEGPEAAVIPLYSRILGDPRHRDCVIITIQLTHRRLFPNWTMGYVNPAGRKGSGPFNELLDYRVVREDLDATRQLLDSLLDILTE